MGSRPIDGPREPSDIRVGERSIRLCVRTDRGNRLQLDRVSARPDECDSKCHEHSQEGGGGANAHARIVAVATAGSDASCARSRPRRIGAVAIPTVPSQGRTPRTPRPQAPRARGARHLEVQREQACVMWSTPSAPLPFQLEVERHVAGDVDHPSWVLRDQARSTRLPTPLRPLVAQQVEPVQDEIEPELERMLIALRDLPDVLLRVFVEERVISDRDLLEDGLREIR